MTTKSQLIILCSVLFAAAARAGEPTPEAGSLLIFPEFDTRHELTVLTVTNTQLTGGDIDVHFEYVDGSTCVAFNRVHRLTAGDTLTLLADYDNPFETQGYVYAYAQDPLTGAAVDHDWLIGNGLSVSGINVILTSTNAFAFKGLAPHGQETDVDGDGIRDLDNVEYAAAPEELLFPRFIAEGDILRSDDLVLINLSGGTAFTTLVDFLVYNDNEELFSTSYSFYCWERVSLAQIAPVFTADFLLTTGHNPDEGQFGGIDFETGWFRLDGNVAFSPQKTIENPAVLATISQPGEKVPIGSTLPFAQGTQPNGSLLPTSPLGDNDD